MHLGIDQTLALLFYGEVKEAEHRGCTTQSIVLAGCFRLALTDWRSGSHLKSCQFLFRHMNQPQKHILTQIQQNLPRSPQMGTNGHVNTPRTQSPPLRMTICAG